MKATPLGSQKVQKKKAQHSVGFEPMTFQVSNWLTNPLNAMLQSLVTYTEGSARLKLFNLVKIPFREIFFVASLQSFKALECERLSDFHH